jgi:hypothetical protein
MSDKALEPDWDRWCRGERLAIRVDGKRRRDAHLHVIGKVSNFAQTAMDGPAQNPPLFSGGR